MESYPTPGEGASKDRHDPVSMKPNIRAVKDGTRIEQAATDYGEFKFFGNGRLLGRCVARDHEDRTPSMSIYTDSQRFKCYGCGAAGDVIDLVMLAEGCETGEALVTLATRYSVELPGRPESWHRKRTRQQAIRDAIDGEKVEHVRRILFRLCFVPWLKQLPEWEREEATESAWRKSLPLAKQIYEGRRT